ncbi:hypothetical protein [Haliangium sp.]|uniref:hypothetical protein n=1 Tax=Haliangium sp. TaxID=2663208 RepID=UPI003D140A71
MRVTRTLGLAAAAVAIAGLSLLGAACKGEQKDGDGDGAGDDKAARARFAYLPTQSNFVIGFDVAQLTASPLFTDLIEPKLEEATGDRYAAVRTACLSKLSSVVVGGQSGRGKVAVMAARGLDQEQLRRCSAALDDVPEDEVTVTQEGKDGAVTKLVSGGDTLWVGTLPDKTLVTQPNASGAATIETILARTGGLSDNPDMMALVDATDTKASLWFAFQNPSGDEAVTGVPYKTKSARGSLRVSDGLTLDVVAQAETAEAAEKMVTAVQAQLEAAKQTPYGAIAENLQIRAKDDEVTVKLALTRADIDALLPVLSQLAPMLRGLVR